MTGQTELATKHYEEGERMERRGEVNPFALSVASNAACIELLFWAITDDSDAESLCSRLTERINTGPERRLLMAHHPLLMVSLEVSILCRFRSGVRIVRGNAQALHPRPPCGDPWGRFHKESLVSFADLSPNFV
jgi:hypothetical protein